MWSCPFCNRTFKHTNQSHYCSDTTVTDFLNGHTDTALQLFDHFISRFEEIGPIELHATKSMIVISKKTPFAYVIKLGKIFVDVVLPFDQLYSDNLCFRKMKLVPGSNDYNHHLRLLSFDDINEEVVFYMKKAYENGKDI